jgi:spore germination protein YaaH
MRAFRLALVWTITSVACASMAAVPTTISPTPPTTSRPPTASTPASTHPTADLTLVLDEVEALAADRGISLEVSNEAGEVLGWLDRDHPELDVDPSTSGLTIRYLSLDGEPRGVAWHQVADMPVTTIRQPWRGQGECKVTLPDGSSAPVVLVWQSGGSSATYVEQLDGAGGVVTVVSPVWWRMGADGSVVSSVDPGYVDAVHDRNVAIWPAIAGFDANTHHLVFSDSRRRSKLAVEISEAAQRIGADGVNIDIEGYRTEDSDGFLVFVEELAALVHDWGGVVSHDLVPRSDTWELGAEELSFWSTAPQRTELSTTTDCTVLMAYDQYNRYRPAGPVASPQWVEEVLVHALRHTDPAQLVLGVPFYGRVWDPDDLERPRAIGIGDLELLVGKGKVSFDTSYGLDRVDLDDGRFFWVETTAGLEHRFDLVAEYGLAGWAAWRFGFDHPEIWNLVDSR